MVQRKIGLTILAIILACRGTMALAQPADATPGEKHAYAFRALTVQVRSYTQQDPREPKETGYGFIAGKKGDILTIVTADHVVRDESANRYSHVAVEFYVDRGRQVEAVVLDHRMPPERGDVAVLEVPLPNYRFSPFPVAPKPDAEGTRAWRVGKQGRWTPSNLPGSYIGPYETFLLAFDNLDVEGRSSGGPILTHGGLVGMVTKVDARVGVVLPIEHIIAFLTENGHPWGHGQPNTAPPAPSPAGAVLAGRFPQFSSRIVAPAEIAGSGCLELRLARNEIFARHGYQFRTQDLREVFAMQPWYQPVSTDVSGNLTAIERQNIDALRSAEAGKGC